MAQDNRTSVFFDRKNSCFVGLDATQIQYLKDIYVDVNVEKELKKMSVWLLSPKGKKRKGHIGFIINWLNNATKDMPDVNTQLNMIDVDSPLRSCFLAYLEELWKGKEQIYHFNTTKP